MESTGLRDELGLGGGKGKEEIMVNVSSYVNGGISSEREDWKDRFQRQNEQFYFWPMKF